MSKVSEWSTAFIWALQVVVGVGDPNPLVGGSGIQTLEAAGIDVEVIGGKEEQDCYEINEDFMKMMEGKLS